MQEDKDHYFQSADIKEPEPRIIYPAKLSFKCEGEVKTLSVLQNLHALPQTLTEITRGGHTQKYRNRYWRIL